MTTSYCASSGCGHPVVSSMICDECTTELLKLLENVDWMLGHLRDVRTRQNRYSQPGGGGSSHEAPLMFNERAAHQMRQYVRTLQKWQARLADHLGLPVRYPRPLAAAAWMWTVIELRGIATWVDAGHMLDELAASHAACVPVIHAPPPRQFLGDCETRYDKTVCVGKIYGTPDTAEASCDTCGATWDATELRLWLLTKMDDRRLSAAEIARIATYMGLTINREQVRKRINQWHARKQIEGDTKDNPRFRFKDVRLLLERDEETRQSNISAS